MHIKQFYLHLGLSVPQDSITVYSSRVLVHLEGFSILLMFVIVCWKCHWVPKAFWKPGIKWLSRLFKGTYKASLSSLHRLVCATRSDHPLACQKSLGTLQPVRSLKEVTFKLSSAGPKWPDPILVLKELSIMCYLEQELIIDSFVHNIWKKATPPTAIDVDG